MYFGEHGKSDADLRITSAAREVIDRQWTDAMKTIFACCSTSAKPPDMQQKYRTNCLQLYVSEERSLLAILYFP